MPAPRAWLASFLPFEGLDFAPAERELLIVETARFAHDEIMLAPFHLRAAVVVLAMLFHGWLAAARLCGISAASAVAAWEKAGGMPARTFTRLIRSLALLYFCEHPAVLQKQGALAAGRRQEIFRARRQSEEAA